MIDPVEFGKAMGEIVREAVAPLQKRIEELEARQLERGEKGEPGADGRNGADGAAGAKGDPGRDGADGKDAEPIVLQDVIAELAVAPEIRTLLELMTAESVQEGVAKALPAAVESYVKANPPKDGRDGIDGQPGRDGVDGAKGDPGKDGAGLAGALIDRSGELVITMTDGAVKSLGVVVGKDGAPGADGQDGLSMADITRTYDPDTHEVVERWVIGGVTKELRVPAGGIRPGGFWNEGDKSFAGQIKTHDGHAWVALRDTAAKPCHENSADWQLFVRKGRDGRDGKDGKAPPAPVSLKAE